MVPIFYKKKKDDDKKDKTNEDLNQYKLIKDDNGRSKINIGELPNPDNRCISYMEQAIDEYYGIEYYLDNVFDKMPKMPSKVLDKFVRNERNKMRRQNIELVEEDIVIRENPIVLVEEPKAQVEEPKAEPNEVMGEEKVEVVEVKQRKPRASRKNVGGNIKAKKSRKKRPI
jgi:hypothetical protein